jgi:uncharacterized protein YeaO (DUF488 family)
MLKVKRVYDKKESGDGRRILVDRLWPRGIAKEEAGIDEWVKELAPGTGLRKWFNHEPAKWQEFKSRYTEELAAPEKVGRLMNIAKNARHNTITLVYGAKDTEHNNARVLEELINGMTENIK